MLTDVTERLASFGYTVVQADAWVLGFISDKVEASIKNDCGIWDKNTEAIVIPEKLHGIAVDRVCGEFLNNKKSTGSLAGFDLTAVAKSITTGDTRVDLTVVSPEQRLDALIDFLLNRGKGELTSHRCIRW